MFFFFSFFWGGNGVPLASEPSMSKEKIFFFFFIRLVLRTEVLTQEKRMFLLHSLGKCRIFFCGGFWEF